MKQYISKGVNTVMAEPAVKVCGKIYPLSGSYPKTLGAEHGYRVIMEGIETFYKTEHFEKLFQPYDSVEERLDVEQTEHYAKLKALKKFMVSDEFESLSAPSKAIFHMQYHHMQYHYWALDARLEMIKGEGAELSCLPFGTALALLNQGYVLRRYGWENGMVIFKQVPARISEEIVPKMTSLHDEAKKCILTSRKIIDYRDQCLIYDTNLGVATSWVPTMEDLFADDWELVITNEQ